MMSYSMAVPNPAKLARAKTIELDNIHRYRDVTHGKPRQKETQIPQNGCRRTRSLFGYEV